MSRTFLVDIDIEDTDLMGLALDIKDDLEGAGYTILSVKPWAGKDPSLSIPPIPLGIPPNSAS